MIELSVDYLTQAIDYNPETGLFIWKVRPLEHFKRSNQMKNWNGRYANTSAGKVDKYGYLNIKVNYKLYRAHRLAWFYVHGYWPHALDHINGDKLDNRICNLREVPQEVNNKNAAKRKDNKSGITGVYWNKDKQKWEPTIGVKGGLLKLGATRDFFEACCKRKSAERKYNYHMNHGRNK